MILNLLTDLVDPDNIPDGYGVGYDLNNGGWVLIGILIAICIILLVVIFVLKIHITDYKKTIKELKEQIDQTKSEESTQKDNTQTKHKEE